LHDTKTELIQTKAEVDTLTSAVRKLQIKLKAARQAKVSMLAVAATSRLQPHSSLHVQESEAKAGTSSSSAHLDDMHALSKSHLAALRDARAALLDQQEATQAAAADAQRHARAAAEAQQRVIQLQGQVRAMHEGSTGPPSDTSAIAPPLMSHIRQLPPLPAYMCDGTFGPVPQDLPEPIPEGQAPPPVRTTDVVAAVHTLCQHYTFSLQVVSLLSIRLRKAKRNMAAEDMNMPGGEEEHSLQRQAFTPGGVAGSSPAQGSTRNTPTQTTQLQPYTAEGRSLTTPGGTLRRLHPGVSPRVSALLGKVYKDADKMSGDAGGGAAGRGMSPGRRRAMEGGTLELMDALHALEMAQVATAALRGNLSVAEAERNEALEEAAQAQEAALMAAAQVDDMQEELVALRRAAAEMGESMADAQADWARREAQLEDDLAQAQLSLLQKQAEATHAAAQAAGEDVSQGHLQKEMQYYGSPGRGGARGLNGSGVSASDVQTHSFHREDSATEGRAIGQLQGVLGEANGHIQALSAQLAELSSDKQQGPQRGDALALKVHDLTSHLLGLQRGMEKLARRTRRLQLQQTRAAPSQPTTAQLQDAQGVHTNELHGTADAASPAKPPAVQRMGASPSSPVSALAATAHPMSPPLSAHRPPRHGTRVWGTPVSQRDMHAVDASPARSEAAVQAGALPGAVDSAAALEGALSALDVSSDSVQALLTSNDRLVAALGEVKHDFASVMGVIRGGSQAHSPPPRRSPPRASAADSVAHSTSQDSTGMAPWAIAMQLAATRAAAAETSAVLSSAKSRADAASVASDGQGSQAAGTDSMSLRRSITAPSVRPVGAAARSTAPKPVNGGPTPARSESRDTGRDFSDQDMTPPPSGTPARLRLVAAGSAPSPQEVLAVAAVQSVAPPAAAGGGTNPAFRGFMPAPVLPPPGMGASRDREAAPPSQYQQAPPRGFRVRVSPMLSGNDGAEHSSPSAM